MININKYSGKGLSGLANLGNTCYINSCFQVLSHCYLLSIALDDNNIINECDDSILLREYLSLRDLMWKTNCKITPNRFINYVQDISYKKGRDLFSGFAQNDLPEFLIFIIEIFHNSIKRPVDININGEPKNNLDRLAIKCYDKIKQEHSNEYSTIIKLFYAVHVSSIKSIIDHNVLSNSCEVFCTLSLPIPNNKLTCDIYECFDLYTDNELLEGENAWFNENTNKKESILKNIMFWSLPTILIIDFKKFTNDNRKINMLINTPLENLDLSKYIIGYDKNNYIYDLFGIINHSGGCLGGHYTSYVKNANNKWYDFNDTEVKEINISKIISNKAYCYIYQKKILE
tara:strand:+ start:236 stop:1267 length:1032 start_codon:yes stop_codon:yes gene_type:complete